MDNEHEQCPNRVAHIVDKFECSTDQWKEPLGIPLIGASLIEVEVVDEYPEEVVEDDHNWDPQDCSHSYEGAHYHVYDDHNRLDDDQPEKAHNYQPEHIILYEVAEPSTCLSEEPVVR